MKRTRTPEEFFSWAARIRTHQWMLDGLDVNPVNKEPPKTLPKRKPKALSSDWAEQFRFTRNGVEQSVAKTQLYDWYYKQKLPIKKILALAEISEKLLYRLLNLWGIPKRSLYDVTDEGRKYINKNTGGAITETQLRDCINQELSLRKIAERVNIPLTTLDRIRAAWGLLTPRQVRQHRT